MTEAEMKAVFLLAGFEIERHYEIANEYSKSREDSWWLVKTKFGLIKIGWRKRVINIDWEDTALRVKPDANPDYEFHLAPLTRDETDQGAEYIHAWGYPKAIEYVSALKLRLSQMEYANSEEGKIDLAKRKECSLQETTI